MVSHGKGSMELALVQSSSLKSEPDWHNIVPEHR